MKKCSECRAWCCHNAQLELNTFQVENFVEAWGKLTNAKWEIVTKELIYNLQDNSSDMYTNDGYCPFVWKDYKCQIFEKPRRPVECWTYIMDWIFCDTQFLPK